MSAGHRWSRLVAVGVLKLWAALAVLFFFEGRAMALRVAVHVPFVESDQKVSEGRRSKFHDMLVTGLKEAAGAETIVVSGEEVRFALGEKPNLLECKDGPCLKSVAELVRADRLIVARIGIKAVVGGSAYTIALTVYDSAGVPTQISTNETCGDDSEGCNLARAFTALKRSTASIAGRVNGSGSATKTDSAVAAAPTAAPPTTTPTLKEPEVAPAPAPAPTGSYNRGYRIGWITAAAVGGAFIIGSIPFLAYAARENEITCGAGVPRDRCPTVYTGNLGPGLGLLIGGGVTSAAAFGVLFYLDRKERRRAFGK